MTALYVVDIRQSTTRNTNNISNITTDSYTFTAQLLTLKVIVNTGKVWPHNGTNAVNTVEEGTCHTTRQIGCDMSQRGFT